MNSDNYSTDGIALKNITETSIPETRLDDPKAAYDYVLQVIRAGTKRSEFNALVQGNIDGNPPFRQSDLIQAGQAHRANINWRVGEAMFGQAKDAIYDIFSETPNYAEVRHNDDDPIKKEEYSAIATEGFERLQKQDKSFDFNMQMSQHYTILIGKGPIGWEDKFSPCIKYLAPKDVYVDDDVPSDVERWERCAIIMDYSAANLYEFIRNGEQARSSGWEIVPTRKAIMKAHPSYRDQQQQGRLWEWHQAQLRNNNFGYSYSAATIRIALVMVKEFSGKVTKLIIPMDTSEGQKMEFLFRSVGYADNWGQVICPMYYDHGTGTHDSVKGIGIKGYSTWEYQNRLLCSIADKSMQPKMALRPLNSEAAMKSQVMQVGDYMVLPPGCDVSQVGFSGMMEDALLANRHFESLLAANLGQYRDTLQKDQGNPVTATQIKFDANNQARLGKTQLARYYEQLDYVYAERYRRAANLSIPSGVKLYKEVKEFHEWVKKQGMPPEELKNVESVQAVRMIGQGSAMLRQQTLGEFMGAVGMLPEEGRAHVIEDWIASKAGQVMVNRYAPRAQMNKLPSDHEALAMLQVVGIKDGVAPVVTSSQNHVIYISTFIRSAFEAVKSLEQGGDPAQVAHFIELAGPAIVAHLDLIKNDPTREPIVKQFDKQLKQLSQIHDKLLAQIKQKQQQMQQQMAKQQQVMSDEQLAQAKLMGDEKRKNFKLQQDTRRKEIKSQSDLRIKDAKAATDIAVKKYAAFAA